jgi:hypothetical protein
MASYRWWESRSSGFAIPEELPREEAEQLNGSLNVTKAALVRLIDGVLYPNPDDPGDPGNPWGPYGPIGPIASGPLREFS